MAYHSRPILSGNLELVARPFERRPETVATEPPPETTTLRLLTQPANVCQAPLFEACGLRVHGSAKRQEGDYD
jgi:hypothetical protein